MTNDQAKRFGVLVDQLQALRAELVALPEPPPFSGTPLVIPAPEPFYVLPAENNEALHRFYGRASASFSDQMDWFSFPVRDVRLYDRDGALLSDRDKDSRADHRTHKLLAGRLTNALAEIYQALGKEEFERQGWHVYGGSHNYRTKTGGSSLSTHAWAAAVDINPTENPFRQTTTTFSDKAINIMEKWGFLSGGRAWGKDWMHFQAVIPAVSSGSYYARNGLPPNIRKA